MPHPLVLQFRFARSEWKRGLAGITDEEARRRFLPMNCISWNIGHLAWQEQRYFLWRTQGRLLLPEINKQFAYGAPPSTPPLAEMWEAWEAITRAADPWLDAQTTEGLLAVVPGVKLPNGGTTNFGTLMQRTMYHYWYHQGECQAIRQMLGHTSLPEFVGDIDIEAPFRVD